MTRAASVAGVNAPAFVERIPAGTAAEPIVGVAGVNAPAFVERRNTVRRYIRLAGGVAGVNAPAFVERT